MADETSPMMGGGAGAGSASLPAGERPAGGGRVTMGSLVALEFFNTYFFTLFAAGASITVSTITYTAVEDHVTIGRLLVAALCAGLAACALIYTSFAVYHSFDHLYVRNHKRQPSRMPVGHFNPAVTLAVALLQDIPLHLALAYFAAQFGGAVCAALTLRGTIDTATQGSAGATVVEASVDALRAILVEVVLTTMLVLLVLVFYLRREFRTQGLILQVAPLVIGAFVTAATILGLPLTGASMNPARSFGPAILAGNFELQWVYWVGPALGAVLATVLFRQYDTRSAVTELG